MTSSSNVKARRSSFLPRGEMGRAELRVVWRKHTRNARLQQEKQPKADRCAVEQRGEGTEATQREAYIMMCIAASELLLSASQEAIINHKS